MPYMHARTACTAYSIGHEGRRTKGGTLCPCHVSPSSTLLATGSYQCDWNRGSSPLSSLSVLISKETFPPGPSYQEGQLYAQPQPLSTPGPALLYYLSIDAWTHGCSVGTCIVSSPWILRRPTFCPWKARKQKTLYDQHDRALAPLSFPKQASLPRKARLKLLSVLPRPEIARLLRRWRLIVFGMTHHSLPNRFPRQAVYPSPSSHGGVLGSAALGFALSVNTSHTKSKLKIIIVGCRPAVVVVKRGTP